MRRRRPRRRPRIWRVTILALATLYFLGPLAASIRFSLVQSNGKDGLGNYAQVFHDQVLANALWTSLELAGLTTAVMLLLMVPTVVWVRLRLPRVALVVETVSVLPIVIPPIVMGAGLAELQLHAGAGLDTVLFQSSLTALTPFYVILALPFAYRSLDVGVRAIDLRTLVEAARSLGAGWFTVILRVIVPNMRTAVLTAVSLTVALVLAEVVIAGTLLYDTYPVELVNQSQEQVGLAVALSVISLLLTWLLLFSFTFIGTRRRRRSAIFGRPAGLWGGNP
jgi:putative spermidine/putrescine transport system permease protein